MDATTKLRAMLRDNLKAWHKSAIAAKEIADQQHERLCELHRDDPAQLRSADGNRRVTLWAMLMYLALDEVTRAQTESLGIGRPLELLRQSPWDESGRTPFDAPPSQWQITRPVSRQPSSVIEVTDVFTIWEIVVEAVIPEWIDHLADDAPALDGLTTDARAILVAMHDLRAFSEEAKITQVMIREKTAEIGEEITGSRLTNAVRIAKDAKCVESKHGTATWLTPQGRAIAEQSKSPSSSE